MGPRVSHSGVDGGSSVLHSPPVERVLCRPAHDPRTDGTR